MEIVEKCGRMKEKRREEQSRVEWREFSKGYMTDDTVAFASNGKSSLTGTGY